MLEKGLSWMALGCGRIVFGVAAWLLAGPALAHSWYPAWCCDDHDCRELIEAKGETVTETAEGWRLWDGRLVGREHAKMSPDAKFHLCEEPRTRAIICFFAPRAPPEGKAIPEGQNAKKSARFSEGAPRSDP